MKKNLVFGESESVLNKDTRIPEKKKDENRARSLKSVFYARDNLRDGVFLNP